MVFSILAPTRRPGTCINSVRAFPNRLPRWPPVVAPKRPGTGTDPSTDELTVDLSNIKTTALSLGATDLLTKDNANVAIGALNDGIDTLQVVRTQVGAGQSRLEFASANIATAIENTEAARSGPIDLDFAAGASDVIKKLILHKAGIFR